MGCAANDLSGWPQAVRESGSERAGIFGGTLGGRHIGSRNFRDRREYRVVANPTQRSTESCRTLFSFERWDVAAHGHARGSLESAEPYRGQKNLAVGAGTEDFCLQRLRTPDRIQERN